MSVDLVWPAEFAGKGWLRRGRRATPRTVSLRPHLYQRALVIIVWCLLPAYWMIVTAFREVAFTDDPTPWFTHFTLDNFATAFSTERGNRFGQALLKNFIVAGITTIVALLIGVFAAYALARRKFRGKCLILGVVFGASMFPGVALMTPLFQLFTSLSWIGTYYH